MGSRRTSTSIPGLRIRGCHAAHWSGRTPVAGQVHRLGLSGAWTLTWQSALSSTTICDELASWIAVFVVLRDDEPPALLTETDNRALPEDLFHGADALDHASVEPGLTLP